MIIGKFTKQASGTYRGHIAALGLMHEAYITATGSGAKASPDYRVLVSDSAGVSEAIEAGAAWKRRSEKTGKAYLSVRLDSPTLAAPINCALVAQDDEPDEFALVWKRRRRGDDATAE